MTPRNATETDWTRLQDALPAVARFATATDWEAREFVQKALREDRVYLSYQPVVSSLTPNPLAFYEALIRIEAEDGSEVLPGAYMSKIEGSPEALALDHAVLRMVLKELADAPDLRLSVNLCTSAMADEMWLAILEGAAVLQPDVAYRLVVEISENADLFDTPEAQTFIAAIRRYGVTVALDDFGAGATMLRHLARVRFDILKIDGCLCKGLAGSADLQCILQAVVDIAQHHDMMTVAEFITCEEDAAMAMRLGIDCLQGSHFGMAAPLDSARPALLPDRGIRQQRA